MSQAEVTRSESIDEQEHARDDDKKPKSRRPASKSFPLILVFFAETWSRYCFSPAKIESMAVRLNGLSIVGCANSPLDQS